jgi:hypothetical protein
VLGRLIDALEIHARCAALFPFARGEVLSPPAVISADDVQRSKSLIVRTSILDEVAEEIDRWAATTSWPETVPLP